MHAGLEEALRGHEVGPFFRMSASAMRSPLSDGLRELAEHSPDRSEHRADEPYRRALTGVHARLAATLHALTGTEALRRAVEVFGSEAGRCALLERRLADPRPLRALGVAYSAHAPGEHAIFDLAGGMLRRHGRARGRR